VTDDRQTDDADQQWIVLHPKERKLVGELRKRLASTGAMDGIVALKEGIERLVELWKAIDRFPSVYEAQRLGSRYRNFATLIEKFAHINPYVTEAYLPTRAVLGRGYGMAKFNFGRLLGVVVEEFLQDEPDVDVLMEDVDDVMRESVCTIIGEDLLMSITSDGRLEEDVRKLAVSAIAGLWEEREVGTMRGFFHVLTSIWRAKASMTINYGTLGGVAELFCLARGGCDEEFLSYFGREDVGADERAALLEFMFNATYEELEVMRRYMHEHGVKALGAEDVARIFNVPLSRLHRTTHRPEDIFFTFRERQVMAAQRRVRNLPGPKKTAEEYVMVYLLRRQLQGDDSVDTASEKEDGLPAGWSMRGLRPITH